MPPPAIPCTRQDCEYSTPAGMASDAAMDLLHLHRQDVHDANAPPPIAPAATSQRPAKIERPTVTSGMAETDWRFFVHEWDRYKRQTGVADQTLIDELTACMEPELRRLAFSEGTQANTEAALLLQIKSLSVTILHPSVHVVSLHDMKQQESETVKSYTARVKGTASNCSLTKKCTRAGCNQDVSYLEETCYHVVMTGLGDADLREKVLTQAMLGNVKDLSTLLNYVTAEESARAQTGVHSQVSGLRKKSSYKQQNTSKCGHCGGSPHGDSNKDRLTKCPAQGRECNNCKKLHHFSSCCKSAKVAATDTTTDSDKSSGGCAAGMSGFLSSLEIQADSLSSPTKIASILEDARSASLSSITTLPLPHYVYSQIEKRWKKQPPPPSPTLTLSSRLDRKAYGELQLQPPRLNKRAGAGHARGRKATTDTGAQLTVINIEELHALGIKQNSIFPVSTSVRSVTAATVDLVGGVFLTFSSSDPKTGETRSTRQLSYVSKTVPGIYLSTEACKALGCVPSSFPEVGQCDKIDFIPPKLPEPTAAPSTAGLPTCENSGIVGPNDIPCRCPKRSLPPTDQPTLPCAPTKENLPFLKQYIMDRFSSSAFNCCEHQPLPLMTKDPPLRLLVDEHATPEAVPGPAVVSAHWVKDVKAGLDRDERLGVIEKVPVNTPLTWCSRMLIRPKHDGSPRRVVDFTPVNKHAPRQTHHTKSPWTIASSIPSNKVKTVIDNWHGYHSVPIHPPDRHLTTFITQFGRYRYRTLPQGFTSAGDGYTQRMDQITGDEEDSERCVDDTILWDNDIEAAFFRICSLLTKCSESGCIFSPNKFQFAEEEVDFIGFRITNTGIQPHPTFLQSIRDFPTPKNITDAKSWFGLVGQISYSFAMAKDMAPFRHLLSSNLPFYWSDELEDIFLKSKEEIIAQCSQGVRSFSLNAPTALATDWSKLAKAFWLTQKFCECPGDPKPGCCPTGWQTVYVGSKFCSPAESRYHPIEGEACASAWALDKCRFFVLGHPNLILAVDHKPLLAIFSKDQDLANLDNPRLLNFKIKAMAFKFVPIYIPGKLHVVPDTLSRRSDSPIADLPTPSKAVPTVNNVLPEYSNSIGPPTWVSSPLVCSLSQITSDHIDEEIYEFDDIDGILMGRVYASLASLTPYAAADLAFYGADSVEVLTWERLEECCRNSDTYQQLHKFVESGVSDVSADWDQKLKPYFQHRHSLSTLGHVVLHYDRPIIPETLHLEVMQHLHAGHACSNVMFERASSSLYWPNYRHDINQFQAACSTCREIAPSNPHLPPTELPEFPDYPFQSVCSDFFSYKARNYLIIVDRYSSWLSVQRLARDDSACVVKALREYCTHFGIPYTFSSDGASVFTSAEMKVFLRRWGIKHRLSSAYYPRSNKRAEVGVKSAKRLIRDNLKPNGDLDTDRFARALLIHRNNPDPSTGISPAQIVFGRQLRDHIPAPLGSFVPRQEWQEAAKKREECFQIRHYKKAEDLSKGSRQLKPLITGDHVYLQNQSGNAPKRWNKSGVILETLPHDSYLVKVDGSRTVTQRNRKFLRKFEPFLEEPENPLLPTPTPRPITRNFPAMPPRSMPPESQAHIPPPQEVPAETPATPAPPAAPEETPSVPVPSRPDWNTESSMVRFNYR